MELNGVKIYGERNSGAIYLEWLLRKNLGLKILETPDLGWKHRLAPSEEELTEELKREVIFICLVKNPYSWLLSLHKRPFNHESLKKLSFTDFLQYSFGDYRNPIVMWNMKNNSYMNLANYVKNHFVVRYEDLLSDYKRALNQLTDTFGLKKPTFFYNINNLLTHSHGIKSNKFHRDYYLEEKWVKGLRPHHIEFINGFLDPSLMKTLNYSIL
ncbi:MAG: hypothetical protein ACNA7V_02290 [Bacteroidales bacterium]